MLTDDERSALDKGIQCIRSFSASAYGRRRIDNTAEQTASELHAMAETLEKLKKRLNEEG